MLSRETLEEYRKMTTAERLQITLEMIRANTPYLFVGTPEQVGSRPRRERATGCGAGTAR